jgi:hypothetical protein
MIISYRVEEKEEHVIYQKHHEKNKSQYALPLHLFEKGKL